MFIFPFLRIALEQLNVSHTEAKLQNSYETLPIYNNCLHKCDKKEVDYHQTGNSSSETFGAIYFVVVEKFFQLFLSLSSSKIWFPQCPCQYKYVPKIGWKNFAEIFLYSKSLFSSWVKEVSSRVNNQKFGPYPTSKDLKLLLKFQIFCRKSVEKFIWAQFYLQSNFGAIRRVVNNIKRKHGQCT